MATEHFDEHAATWDDDPDKVRRSEEIARLVAVAVPASPGTRLLEYGAGTGLVTQSLLHHVGPVTVADSSVGMRAVLHRKVADGRLPAGTRVWDLDLERQVAPAERFDLVVSSMVLHHVRDLTPVLRGFAALLGDGGHLCVADLDLEDGSFHAQTHDFDGHAGFDRAGLARAVEAEGFAVEGFAEAAPVEKEGTAYPVFLLTARRVKGLALPSPQDHKAWLHRYLQQAREAMLWKLEGLSDYDVRRPLTPTGTNLLGLVKHLAGVELGYLGETFGRPSGIPLPWYEDGADHDADMWVTAEESRADVVALYRRAWAHGDATITDLDLDTPGTVPHWRADRAQVTLGRILTHLIAETHRHAGHADILRELIDGEVGMRPDNAGLPERAKDDWAAHRERVERAARAAASR